MSTLIYIPETVFTFSQQNHRFTKIVLLNIFSTNMKFVAPEPHLNKNFGDYVCTSATLAAGGSTTEHLLFLYLPIILLNALNKVVSKHERDLQ